VANRSDLLALLERTAAKSASTELSLGEVIGELKDASFCFVGILVCLPFLVPLPVLGPLTIPGGLAIAALGWQMMRGASEIRLPKRFAAIRLGHSAWSGLLKACQKVLRICERFSKPRLAHWVEAPRGEWLAGFFVFIGGALLAIPMGGVVPFNNTLPALCAMCGCVALLEHDGAWFLCAAFWLVVTLIYFAIIAYFFVYFGVELKLWLAQHLPTWMH
jgi:hypothetical protein